jgi:hypothetical protein
MNKFSPHGRLGRLQRQCWRALILRPAWTSDLRRWCYPRKILIENRRLTNSEASHVRRAARSIGARAVRTGGWQWRWELPPERHPVVEHQFPGSGKVKKG